MANDNDTSSAFRELNSPSVGSHSPLSGESASAPWTGRRMYASGLSGAVPVGESDADETERSGLGVAESAVWNSFLHRIIKKG